jgi:Helix-turn-helix domain
MDERLRLVAKLLDGESMTDVCREFGISRKTGYKIFRVNASASRRSTMASGSSASCSTISATSTWSRKPCNLSTTRSARGCHLCLRYGLLPMSQGVQLRSGAPGRIRTHDPLVRRDRDVVRL